MPSEAKDFLYADNVKKYFLMGLNHGKKNNQIRAVDGVTLHIKEKQVFGLVGESGCGKTTLLQMMLGMYNPTSGAIYYKYKNMAELSGREKKQMRRDMQIVFQDPYDSLNPKMTIAEIIREPLYIHKIGNRIQQENKVSQLINMVGLSKQQLDKYPGQLSGGQRQRVSIARALALSPKLIACDEPVSALDVSIQAQILNLLKDLKDELELTLLFVSHDLSVVNFISDYIGVMYYGKIVEQGDKEKIVQECVHPYSQALFSTIPGKDIFHNKERIVLKGEMPDLFHQIQGCAFCSRCPYADENCYKSEPALQEISPGHYSACDKGKNLGM